VGTPDEHDALRVAQAIVDIGLDSSDETDTVVRLGRVIAPFAHVRHTGVGMWNDSREYIQMLPGSFDAGREIAASSQVNADHTGSIAALVARDRQPRFTNDAIAELPRVAEWLRGFGIHQLLTLPLVAGDVVVGVFHLADHETSFSEDDIQRIAPLLPFVASTILQVVQRRRLQRQEALSTLIGSMATAIVSGRPLDEISQTLFSEFCRASDSSVVAVTFHADASPSVVTRFGDVELETERVFLAEALEPRTTLTSILSRPQRAGELGSFAIHVPIMIVGRAEGTLSILRVPGVPFSEVESAAIIRLSNVMALAWASENYQLQRAQNARMQERQRIADDLHDQVAQLLFSGELALASLRYDLPDGTPAAERARQAQELVVQGQLALREAIHNLSQPEPRSVPDRLTQSASLVEAQFGIGIHVEIEPEAGQLSRGLAPAAASIIVQIAREAMVNAAKHAGPCRVSVDLRRQGRSSLVLMVVDDGIGARPHAKKGHGIATIRRNVKQLGGSFSITRGKLGGTRYRAVIPVHAD
jgi:signal transduction histidine kinase